MARRKTTFVLNNEERKKNRAEEKFPNDYEFLIITYKVDASSNNDYIIYHSRPRESQLDRFTTWRTIEHCLQRLLCWIIDHFHSEIFCVILWTKNCGLRVSVYFPASLSRWQKPNSWQTEWRLWPFWMIEKRCSPARRKKNQCKNRVKWVCLIFPLAHKLGRNEPLLSVFRHHAGTIMAAAAATTRHIIKRELSSAATCISRHAWVIKKSATTY